MKILAVRAFQLILVAAVMARLTFSLQQYSIGKGVSEQENTLVFIIRQPLWLGLDFGRVEIFRVG